MRHVRVYESLVIKGGAAASQYFNANSAEILAELRARHASQILADDDGDDDDGDQDDPDACPECAGSGKCEACNGTGSKKSETESE